MIRLTLESMTFDTTALKNDQQSAIVATNKVD